MAVIKVRFCVNLERLNQIDEMFCSQSFSAGPSASSPRGDLISVWISVTEEKDDYTDKNSH